MSTCNRWYLLSDGSSFFVSAKSTAKKWTSLRDRWMKCHRRLKEMKSGSGAKKIRKCDFYDEMLFLTKIVTRRDTESNIPETTNVEKSPVENIHRSRKKRNRMLARWTKIWQNL